jgi:aquaporin Z
MGLFQRPASSMIVEAMWATLRKHWPEYMIEAAGLGTFMISACSVAILLEHPGSPVRQALPDPLVRRLLMGMAMGLTFVGIAYSPWGKQSGAHLNPAVTLTFFRLGKVGGSDAAFYVAAQTAGGAAGVVLVAGLAGGLLAHPSVNYVVTVPGAWGIGAALAAEALMALGIMTIVLVASNDHRLMRATPLLAGILVATYITVEAPISGMSMNPARTLASALSAGTWTALWVYVLGPLAGMLLAAELYVRGRARHPVRCAKLHHLNDRRCIFRCGFAAARPAEAVARVAGDPLIKEAHA